MAARKYVTKQDLQDYIVLLEEELAEERKGRLQDAEDFRYLEREYEEQIADLKQELLNTKGKIISQDITLASYKEKVGIPLIIEGAEHDLYTGEQKDYLISLLKAAMKNSGINTRAYKICSSLLEANHEVGKRKEMMEGIAAIMRSAQRLNQSEMQDLNSYGIDVIETSNHVKLCLCGDSRYTVSIAHTPTDNRRTGLNTVSNINQQFF